MFYVHYTMKRANLINFTGDETSRKKEAVNCTTFSMRGGKGAGMPCALMRLSYICELYNIEHCNSVL